MSRHAGPRVVILLGLFVSIFSGGATAQQAAIDAGLDYLELIQDPSGWWEPEKDSYQRDGLAIGHVLVMAGGDTTTIRKAFDAMEASSFSSVDLLARRVLSVSAHRDRIPSPTDIDLLSGSQGEDGGWGHGVGYGSSLLETAVVLRALGEIGYQDAGVLGSGLDYLSTGQNADGGWGFVPGDSSSVFFTAHVILSLAALEDQFDVSAVLSSGVTWLKSQMNPDSGFGSGGVSTIATTGLALAAMTKVDPASPEVVAARLHIEGRQLPDGSWEGDAYSTALGVYGLIHWSPDLLVSASDLNLSNPAPSDSEVVLISARVRNSGATAASSFTVQFFDGNPAAGGDQIGTNIAVGGLPAGGDTTVSVYWNTYPMAGDHEIIVVVDSDSSVSESNEANNFTEKAVHVLYPPDLVVRDSLITFSPTTPEPGQATTISVTVRNTGEEPAYDVNLQIWDGNPDLGGAPLMGSPYVIPEISPGAQFTLNLDMGSFFSQLGSHVIFACADPDHQIRETREYDNCGSKTLYVGFQLKSVFTEPGLNLLGLPLAPIDSQFAFGIIPQIPNCYELDGWDRDLQRWLSAIDIGGGQLIGDNFPVRERDGFFSRVEAAGTFGFAGRAVSEHGCTALEPGLNLVSIPNEDACYTGFSILSDIAGATSAFSWDPATQQWLSAIKVGSNLIGDDFAVYPGYSYFVEVPSAVNWCSQTCDTNSQPPTPDLLVTYDDIYLNPNPTVSGSVCTVAVNISNIGTATAVTPRLDIYAGDPALGGSQLLGGYLPDIPAGGASGYYGLEVTFTGSGVVDIFGIADFWSEIDELDETNNQASRPLTINPVLLERDKQPVAAAADSATALVRFVELEPALTDPAGAQGSILKSTVDVSCAVSPLDLLVGNISSSSASAVIRFRDPAPVCVTLVSTSGDEITRCNAAALRSHIIVFDNLESDADYSLVLDCSASEPGALTSTTFRTTPIGTGKPHVLYGRVEASNGTPIENALIAAVWRDGENESVPIAGLSDENGIYHLNIGNLKALTDGSPVSYAASDTILLSYYNGTASLQQLTAIGDIQPTDLGTTVLAAPFACGDLDLSGSVDVQDLVMLVDYLFRGGSMQVIDLADVNCSRSINVSDILHLVDYLFRSGPYPCTGCLE